MSNRLKQETSPYLLQHAENPVDWYPWGEEAFRRAREEDKPVFLSIGYSTCHWCHVMAHESFEDREIAEILNRDFISIKVDKEERPDIDSIYMAVCQAFTGGGGWPTSVFLTPEQKPFFAGTYFPRTARGGMVGLMELLLAIRESWNGDRELLLQQAEGIVAQLGTRETFQERLEDLSFEGAAEQYRRMFDRSNGGFGRAPKFPTPHNLLFLLNWYQRSEDRSCLDMAEKTLLQMYRGGLFDHIGGGFCRYSTDARFLAPHFEKMLYDNALLILAYCKAYTVTKKPLYLQVARRTAGYVLTEMTSDGGGFYSAQDADSEGEEGKYYLFTPEEITGLLGEQAGRDFCRQYDITERGNFEGKNIPNLLKSDVENREMEQFLLKIAQYRRGRYALHLDDKILTSWNGLMIAALCRLYRVSGEDGWLEAARRAERFLQVNLQEREQLFVSFRAGRRGVPGFLDDHAAWIFALLELYGATLEPSFLERAQALCRRTEEQFCDWEEGGFFLYGADRQRLVLRPKETYDGAIPSGNGLMAWNLVRLWHLTGDEDYRKRALQQLDFLAGEAAQYPLGHAMAYLARLELEQPLPKVTVVSEDARDKNRLPLELDPDAPLVWQEPSAAMPLKDGKTTYYVCKGHTCLPPANALQDL